MRIFSREKRETGNKNLSISILFAGLPLTFIFGLMVGYQLWGQPDGQAANPSAAQPNQQPAAAQRYDIPIDDFDEVRGPADAKVVMVEFTDYECPYCQRYYIETYTQIIETYGDQILYVVKDLPLTSIHPNAVPAAIAAHCAGEQDSFWEFHGLLFEREGGLNDQLYQGFAENLNLEMDSFNDCLDSGRYDQAVLADTNILQRINARISTPTFFINGQYVAGAQPFSVFAGLIEAELAAAE